MTTQAYDYSRASENEINRLKIQAEILRDFDKPVFDEILNQYHQPVIVDIGCNNGDCSMMRLRDREYLYYLGVDRSAQAVECAQNSYTNHNTEFICADVTDEAMVECVKSHLPDKCGGADIIVVSMLLLHLENPPALLFRLHSLLRCGGTIIVKDIDDRDNTVSFDPDGIFAYSYTIADRNCGSGNRHTGRNIPEWLGKAGYNRVTHHKTGLSTAGMSIAQREAVYTTYFGFFEEDCQAQMTLDPSAENDLRWCRRHLPIIKEYLLKENFEFSLGFCIYSAGY
ncbi:MAG: class I SAM-dependent methyltransferase [Oscillospiraceae bacterium]